MGLNHTLRNINVTFTIGCNTFVYLHIYQSAMHQIVDHTMSSTLVCANKFLYHELQKSILASTDIR